MGSNVFNALLYPKHAFIYYMFNNKKLIKLNALSYWIWYCSWYWYL